MGQKPGRFYPNRTIAVVLCLTNLVLGTDVLARLGKSVQLVCPFRSTSLHPIIWLGPENLIGYAINKEINKDIHKRNRLSLTGDHVGGEYNLVIHNATKQDEGLYQCLTLDKERSVTADFNLRVLKIGKEAELELWYNIQISILYHGLSPTYLHWVSRKPTVFLNHTTVNITARLEQVSDVNIYVDCFPKPTVSWMKILGGKVGTWKQIERKPGEYKLESTILPSKPSHFGQYTVLLRNTEGSDEITIHLTSYEPKIHHDPYSTCYTSKEILLSCSILTDYNVDWNVIWQHYGGGVRIRTLNGSLANGTSVLRIKYCDYQDAGMYICFWSSGNLQALAKTILTIYGPPIKTSQSLSLDKDSVAFSVSFYSSSAILDISWFSHDNQITENMTSLLQNVNTSLLCYDVPVPIIGTEIGIELNNPEYSNAKLSCQIRNEFGSTVAIFDQHQNPVEFEGTPDIYTQTHVESYSSETSIVTVENTDSVLNSGVRADLEYMYLYAIVSGAVIVILLVVVSVTVYKNWKMLHARLGVNQDVITHIRAPIPQNDSVNTEREPADSLYDEIDSVSYQSVTWRNYSFIKDDSILISTSTDEESSINIANPYDDLTHSQDENHCYCEGPTHMNRDFTPQKPEGKT